MWTLFTCLRLQFWLTECSPTQQLRHTFTQIIGIYLLEVYLAVSLPVSLFSSLSVFFFYFSLVSFINTIRILNSFGCYEFAIFLGLEV